MGVLADGLQCSLSCVPGGALFISFCFLFSFLKVRRILLDGRIGHRGFVNTWLEIVQVDQILVVKLGSCFQKESVLSVLVKTWDAYVNVDMFYFLVMCVSVTT